MYMSLEKKTPLKGRNQKDDSQYDKCEPLHKCPPKIDEKINDTAIKKSLNRRLLSN